MMNELQSDDLYFPVYLLESTSNVQPDGRNFEEEDFLKNVKGWTEYHAIEECLE